MLRWNFSAIDLLDIIGRRDTLDDPPRPLVCLAIGFRILELVSPKEELIGKPISDDCGNVQRVPDVILAANVDIARLRSKRANCYAGPP